MNGRACRPTGTARRRQVCFEYPPPLRLRVCARAQRMRRRDVAQALRLPVSTVYRWLADARSAAAAGESGADADLESLVAQCERLGFFHRRRLRAAGIALAECGPVREPAQHDATPVCPRDDAHGAAAVLDAARDFIERGYYGALSCDQLAARAGMSKFHFIKEYRRQFGITPYRYLLQVRIAQACRMLELRVQAPADIALAVGFNDLSAFLKAFRAQRGLSVTDYQRDLQARRAAGSADAGRRDTASGASAPG